MGRQQTGELGYVRCVFHKTQEKSLSIFHLNSHAYIFPI